MRSSISPTPCAGSASAPSASLAHGADLPFAFEHRWESGRPTLYEYRPLVRGYIEAHAEKLRERDDVAQGASPS